MHRLRETRGSTLVEHLLLVGLVALATLAGLHVFGGAVERKAKAEAECVASLACATGASAAAATAEGEERRESPSTTAGAVGAAEGEGRASPKTVLRRIWDFAVGFVEQAVSMIPATIDVILHPIETIEAIAFAVQHPISTYHAVKDALAEAWRSNPEELSGRIVFEIVTLPLVAGKLSKLRTVARVQKAVHTMASARTLHRAERVRMVVENATRANHAMHAGELAEEAVHEQAEEQDAHAPNPSEDTAHAPGRGSRP